MILEEKHQQAAIEIVQKNRKKKSCNKCYDRGYIGFSADKTIVPCDKCVDIEKAYEDWKNYVSEDEKLKADFHELFEEEEKAETDEPADTEAKEFHAPTKQTPTKKEGSARKEANLKTQKSTTVRKSGNR